MQFYYCYKIISLLFIYYCSFIVLLHIWVIVFQDVGLAHICDGASEQGSRSGLNTLVVWNNQITYESMIALGRALVCL